MANDSDIIIDNTYVSTNRNKSYCALYTMLVISKQKALVC